MLKSFRLGGLLMLVFALGLLAACDTNPVPTATTVPPTPTPAPTATPVPATPVPATGGPFGIPASPAEIALINDAITKTVAADSYHYNAALEIPGTVANTSIVGDYKSPDAAHMSVTGGGKTTEIVNIGQTTYIKNPDGSWTSGDVSQAAGSVHLGSMGAMAGNIDPTKTSNIVRLLAGFVSGINSANKVGSETISGTQTTRYNVPVFLGNLMGTGGSTTPGEQPLGYANVWIDPNTKLIQRLNAHLDLTDLMRSFAGLSGPTPDPALPSPTPLPPVVINMSVELGDFGKVVEITAPANATPAAIPGVPTNTTVATAPTTAMAGETPTTAMTSTTGGTLTGSGADILKASIDAMRAIKTYHFTMDIATNTSGQTGTTTEEGEVALPNSMAVTVNMSVAGQATSIKTVKIGADTWINATGNWTKSTTPAAAISPSDLANTFSGTATDLGDTVLDGVDMHHVKLIQQDQAPNTTIEVWIDKATNYITQMKLTANTMGVGQAPTIDSSMKLSKFNDPSIKVVDPTKQP